jgi:hypothetical protein
MAYTVTINIIMFSHKTSELCEKFQQRLDTYTDIHIRQDDFNKLMPTEMHSAEYSNGQDAKWCIVNKIDKNSQTICLKSGWNYPKKAVDWIVNELNKLDPKARVEVRYSDEVPNFMGVELYKGPAHEGVADYLSEGERWDEQALKLELDATNETDNIWECINILEDAFFKDN